MKRYIYIIVCCVTLLIGLSVVSAGKKHGKGGGLTGESAGKKHGKDGGLSVASAGKKHGKGGSKGCKRRTYLPTPDKECVEKMCQIDKTRCVPEYERIFVFLKRPVIGGVGFSPDVHIGSWPQTWTDYNACIGYTSLYDIGQAGRKAIQYYETFFGIKEVMDLQAAVTDDQLINGENRQFPDFSFNSLLDTTYINYLETKGREVNYYTNPPPVFLGGWYIQFKKDIYLNGTGYQGWALNATMLEWGHYLIESGKFCGFDDKVVVHFEARQPIVIGHVAFESFTMLSDIYGEGMTIGQFGRPFRDTDTTHTGVILKFPAHPQNCA